MNRCVTSSLCSIALAGAIPAQEPPTGLAEVRVPVHTADDDNGVAYGTWAASQSYKASFHDGMTFVPYLGPSYPQNRPWSWRTTSVRAGESELLESGAEPTPWHDDYRYEYRFGAVTERYDVGIGGLEQSFVVTRLPQAGDLVVRGTVTSSLHAESAAPRHGALQFFDDAGREILGYGAAFAIDAAGSRLAIDTAFANGEITLTVPAAWLAAAKLPVTVDPILTRSTIDSDPAGADVGRVVVSASGAPVGPELLFAWQRFASQTDSDLFAASETSVPFPTVTAIYADLGTTWTSDQPTCAYSQVAGRWALVWRRWFTGLTVQNSGIRAHLTAGIGYSTLVTGFSTPTGYNAWRPSVGGQRSYSHFLVAYQRENNSTNAGNLQNTPTSDVLSVILSSAGGGFSTTHTALDSGTTRDAERPFVNRLGGPEGWLVAIQRADANVTTDDWDVVVRKVSSANQLSPVAWTTDVGNSNTKHQVAPMIDGTDGRYLVAFSTIDRALLPYQTQSSVGNEFWVQRLDWPATSGGPSLSPPPVRLESDVSRLYQPGGVGYDLDGRSHFAVGIRVVAPGTPSVRAHLLGYHGESVEAMEAYNVPGHEPVSVDCVYRPGTDHFALAYGVLDNNTNPVYRQYIRYAQGGGVSTGGSGCSTAQLAWQGSVLVGSAFNEVEVTGSSLTAGHFMAVSLGSTDVPANYPGVGTGCRLLVDIGPLLLGTLAFQIGPSPSWPFPLPEFLPSMSLHFQDWILDTGTLFQSTQRLTVSIVK